MKKTTTTEYTFTEEEMRDIIRPCLDYAWHRLTKHNKKVVNKEKLEALRSEIYKDEIGFVLEHKKCEHDWGVPEQEDDGIYISTCNECGNVKRFYR